MKTKIGGQRERDFYLIGNQTVSRTNFARKAKFTYINYAAVGGRMEIIMKGIKILIGATALAAVGAGATGILLNTRRARMMRMAKRAGRIMYAVGGMLQTLSCQGCED